MESGHWGKKMYLISPSEFDFLNKKKMMRPQYENRSAADFRSQKNDEKIFSSQIADKLEKERQKTDFKDLVQPILATSAIPSFTEKEKIKQILLILKNQSNVVISNNELKVDGQKYELHSFINDLLSHKSSFEYDIEPIISTMKKAKINPSLVPNPNIAKLLETEGNGKESDKDSTIGNDTDNGDYDDEASEYTLATGNDDTAFSPSKNSTPLKSDQIGAAIGSSPNLKPPGAIPKLPKNEEENSSVGADSKIKKEDKKEDKKKKKIKDSPGIAVASPRRSERETDRPTQYGKGWTKGFKTWKRF